MCKNKIIITIVIAILCVMLFSIRVFAENTTTGEDVEEKNTEEKITLNDVVIRSNGSKAYGDIKVNLVLGEHETETLWIDIQNIKEEDAKNIQVEWTSSSPSVVTVEQDTGVLKAIKEGSATITATIEDGISRKCEVTVLPAPQFTDFSNAKYDIVFEHENTNLKISGIIPKGLDYCTYYYMITSSATKPTLSSYKDVIIVEDSEFEHNIFEVNTKENYIYFDDGTDRKLDSYLELNQDLYLWVIQQVEFAPYTTEDGMRIGEATKFVVEGKKLERPQLKLNQIISGVILSDDLTSLGVNYPMVTENRKCTVKIGKVTDYELLKKIQNNDYTGTTDLLNYAKNNQAIHESVVLLDKEGRYNVEKELFNGNTLLTNNAYYYVYMALDDEDGKYYPVEGISLGQAYLPDKSEYWSLVIHGDDGFKWEHLNDSAIKIPDENKENETNGENQTTVPSVEKNDQTTSGTKIPHAGEKTIIPVILIIILASIVSHKKLKKFKDII